LSSVAQSTSLGRQRRPAPLMRRIFDVKQFSAVYRPCRWADPAHRSRARAKHSYGHRHLQGRHRVYRRKAIGRLSGSWRGPGVGRGVNGNQPCRDTSTSHVLYKPPRRSEPRWRPWASLGQYRQQGVSLPRRSLVRQDQARQLYVRSGGAGTGRSAGPRQGLHLVGRSKEGSALWRLSSPRSGWRGTEPFVGCGW
jgi:hypothetical protein